MDLCDINPFSLPSHSGLSGEFCQKQAIQERSPADKHYIGGCFRPVHFIASLAYDSAYQNYDNAECEHSGNQGIVPPIQNSLKI
jgi:hypothetical protein